MTIFYIYPHVYLSFAEGSGSSSGGIDTQSQKLSSTPSSSSTSSRSKKKQSDGGDFFNDWLPSSSPSASLSASTQSAEKPKRPRPTSASKKMPTRKTSSSSLSSDNEGKEQKPHSLNTSGSESAFKTVSSQDSLLAASEASSNFEEIQVDSSSKDEEQILTSTSSHIPTSKSSAETHPKEEMKPVSLETVPQQDSSDDSKPKKKGPMKLGSKKVKKDTEEATQATADNSDKTDACVKDIPQAEEETEQSRSRLDAAPLADQAFNVMDQTGQSDWSDMSLSLLTESQMSIGSNKSAEFVTADMVSSMEVKSEQTTEQDQTPDVVENQEDRERKSEEENVKQEESQSSDANDQSEESGVVDEVKESKEEEDEAAQSISRTSMCSVEENVMAGSHESGELSDSNKTITGEEEEEEDEEDSRECDVSSETEAKDTDSGRDRSSSIQSITEPSSSPSQQSPEMIRRLSDESHDPMARKEGEMSSSGYVKNMLEEAMVESCKDTDSHADSSDLVRIESGSGHTSADEIETQTSSDIEIISHISTPTSNNGGDYRIGGVERPFDLSPLRHAFGRSMTRSRGGPGGSLGGMGPSPPLTLQGHMRTDSSGSSSMSFHSGNGHDVTSPPGMVRHLEPPLADAVASSMPLQSKPGQSIIYHHFIDQSLS